MAHGHVIDLLEDDDDDKKMDEVRWNSALKSFPFDALFRGTFVTFRTALSERSLETTWRE